MNAKTFILAAALAVAANVSAAERAGRDSVYADPGARSTVMSKGAAVAGNGRASVYAVPGAAVGTPVESATVPGNGRSSVYAADILAARDSETAQSVTGFKAGRG